MNQLEVSNLPEQGSTLQCSTSVLSPSHSLPPYCARGLTQALPRT